MHQLHALHSWLLSVTDLGAPYVIIDTGARPIPGCAEKITSLLNEFDDADGLGWIHLDPGLVRQIASSLEHRRILGIDDPSATSEPTGARGIRRVISSFARRGRFVVNHPEATRALARDPRGFRAAIGRPVAGIEEFHLILNPTRFRPQCLASLVADSYLEWAATSRVA